MDTPLSPPAAGPSRPAPNPITARLTRDIAPPARIRRWVGPGAALGGFALALGVIALLDALLGASATLPLVAAGLLSAPPLLYPSICMIGAASITTRMAAEEEVMLLRLTGLDGAAMLNGFLAGIGPRMWPARALLLWLPAGLITGAALGPPRAFDGWTLALLVQIIPYVLGMASLLHGLGQIMMYIGVSVGLRWPRRAAGIGAGTAFVVLTVIALAAVGAFMLNHGWGSSSLIMLACGSVGLWLGAMPALVWLDRLLRRAAIAFIDGR